MARYGRRSNHWMWQPRDSRGRFSSSGGGGTSGYDMPGFRKLGPVGKTVFVIAALVLTWKSIDWLYILGPATIVVPVVFIADILIDKVILPVEEE